MAVKTMCLITFSEVEKGAYGVRVDNDENIYFPVGISEAAELEEFEEVEAILIKNDREVPIWKAIKVRRPNEH